MSPDAAVLTEVRGRILVITLNRPEAMNAINSDVSRGLLAAIDHLDGDPDLVVGVLAGRGRGFCSGMDLKAFAESGEPDGLDRIYELGARKPLICAVEGFALAGGLELALTADLIVAARGAKFGIPEVRVGLFAAGGALMRLPRRLPQDVAMELALTGDPISAEDAAAYGLVRHLTEAGAAVDEALGLADRIAENAPLAVVASKELIRGGAGRTEAEYWDLQRQPFDRVYTSNDAIEGPAAFAEKRAPRWTAT